MKQIQEITQQYELSEAEKAALDGVLYGVKEGRIPTSEAHSQLKRKLSMAMSIRREGVHDLEPSGVRVSKAYSKFIRENRGLLNVNRDASMGQRRKRKKQVYRKVTPRTARVYNRT
jgi:hypothetical protein